MVSRPTTWEPQGIDTVQAGGWRVGWGTDPVSSDGQWVGRVHVPLPIVARLPVTEDLHLEVADHGVHHLSVGAKSGAAQSDPARGAPIPVSYQT